MSYQDLIDKGLLLKEDVNLNEIKKVLIRAHKDLKSSEFLLKKDEEAAFKLAYDAMLLAGRALVFLFGLRPKTVGSHKIVVEFTKRILGDHYENLIKKFNQMRKKRHYIIYGISASVSETEANNAIKSARELLSKVEEYFEKQNPQQKLLK